MNDRFWLEDFGSLFRQTTIFPNSSMTESERLNTMTRLILVITLLLFLLGLGSWALFLTLGLGLVIILYHVNKYNSINPPLIENYRCNRRPPIRSKSRKIKVTHKKLIHRNKVNIKSRTI